MQSDHYSTAVRAFIKAQSEMGKAAKSAKNPFHKSVYAPLDVVIDTVLPPFNNNGFALMQVGGADEYGHFVSTQLIHENGQTFECKIYVPSQTYDKTQGKAMPIDMQGLGSAITYAKRYGIHALTGLSTEDDDGNRATGRVRNMDAAHDQAVREEREELAVNPPSASSPGGSGFATTANAPANPGGSGFGMTANAPADDIPWPEPEDQRWQDWMMRIKTQVSKMTATWQIKKLGEKENDNLKSLRQFKNEWANELIAYIDVRWDLLNNGER